MPGENVMTVDHFDKLGQRVYAVRIAHKVDGCLLVVEVTRVLSNCDKLERDIYIMYSIYRVPTYSISKKVSS